MDAGAAGSNEKVSTVNSEEEERIGMAYRSEVRYRGWKAMPCVIGTYLLLNYSIFYLFMLYQQCCFSLFLSLNIIDLISNSGGSTLVPLLYDKMVKIIGYVNPECGR